MRTIDLRDEDEVADIALKLPRPEVDTTEAVRRVKPIMEDVRKRSAAALYDLSEKFDGVRPKSLRVPESALKKAFDELDEDVAGALRVAIRNARIAHEHQLPEPTSVEILPGGTVFQRWVPLGRVGLYVPGGLAVYPSSVVMNVVPAQVAGVESMVVASPPQKEFGGLPHPTILAACHMLGVSEVIAVGGAQAIAAMAYGFHEEDGKHSYTCEPVDKVTGPGNVYVAAAKRVVQEVCGIDSEAGTSEIAVLADETANAFYVAHDLVSQAEHDPAAAAVLVTDSEDLAKEVAAYLPDLIEQTEHSKRVATAMSGPQSGVVLTRDLDQSVKVINGYAPEHLEIMTDSALAVSEEIVNAGAIFIGDYSPVPLGDYVGGSNHVLPTGGTARYSSGLNVTQFLKSIQVIDYSRDALAQVTADLVTLAASEGLPAHGDAALARFKDGDPEAHLSESKHSAERPAVQLPVRGELQEVEPYGAPVVDVPVRLNVNENPFEPHQAVIESIAEAVKEAASGLNRYSDREAWALREELSTYLRMEAGVRVPASQIWAANGSNEIMLQLLQAFGGPGRLAMAQWPTYSMYPEYARDTNTDYYLVGGKGASRKNRKPPRFKTKKLINAMRAHRPAVVFIPSPNNPTGSPVPVEKTEEILQVAVRTGPKDQRTGEPTSSIIVVDEAYAEFRDPGARSALDLLDRYPNLVVTRTMSKAFAAAGLRLGYMIASPQVVEEVRKVRLPYHLSLLTQAAAVATLKHADSQLAQVGLLREERDRLNDWLQSKGLQVAPSASNFLMFGPLEDPSEVWKKLLDRGVLIREVGPSGYLRVTVGTPEENKVFKEALGEIL